MLSKWINDYTIVFGLRFSRGSRGWSMIVGFINQLHDNGVIHVLVIYKILEDEVDTRFSIDTWYDNSCGFIFLECVCFRTANGVWS